MPVNQVNDLMSTSLARLGDERYDTTKYTTSATSASRTINGMMRYSLAIMRASLRPHESRSGSAAIFLAV